MPISQLCLHYHLIQPVNQISAHFLGLTLNIKLTSKFLSLTVFSEKKTPTQIQFADEKNTFNPDMPPHFIFSQQIEFKMKVFRFPRIPKEKLKINFPYETWTKLNKTTRKTSKELPCNMIAQLKCCKVETFLFFLPLQIICRFLWRKKKFAKFSISFVELNSNCGKMLSGGEWKHIFKVLSWWIGG